MEKDKHLEPGQDQLELERRQENRCLSLLLSLEPQDGIAAALGQPVRHNALYCHLLVRSRRSLVSGEFSLALGKDLKALKRFLRHKLGNSL